MKKLCLSALLCLIFLLNGCSTNESIHNSYDEYRNYTASQLYHSGTQYIKTRHYDKATTELEALNALYPFGAYAEEGQVNLIYAYYKNNEADEAIALADRYLRLYPDGKYAAYVYYMKGVIASDHGLNWIQRKFKADPSLRDTSYYQQAYMAFNQLLKTFPHSEYAPDAAMRIRYIRNLLASRQLRIAEFYFKEKAYVAAANRAQEVVKHYDKTPAVIPALGVMVKSYRALHLDKMANDTLAILAASYPTSKTYQGLKTS